MKTYDVSCPNCGRMNRDLLLEDSQGWMECESCGCISRVRRGERLAGCRESRGGSARAVLPAERRTVKARAGA